MTPVTSIVAGLLQHQMTRHFSRPQVSDALPAALQQEGPPLASLLMPSVCSGAMFVKLSSGYVEYLLSSAWHF